MISTAEDFPCSQLVELVTEYMEGVLPDPVRRRFEVHLEICPGCRLYLGQMRLTIGALRAQPDGMGRACVRDQSLQKFRQWKRQRGE